MFGKDLMGIKRHFLIGVLIMLLLLMSMMLFSITSATGYNEKATVNYRFEKGKEYTVDYIVVNYDSSLYLDENNRLVSSKVSFVPDKMYSSYEIPLEGLKFNGGKSLIAKTYDGDMLVSEVKAALQ